MSDRWSVTFCPRRDRLTAPATALWIRIDRASKTARPPGRAMHLHVDARSHRRDLNPRLNTGNVVCCRYTTATRFCDHQSSLQTGHKQKAHSPRNSSGTVGGDTNLHSLRVSDRKSSTLCPKARSTWIIATRTIGARESDETRGQRRDRARDTSRPRCERVPLPATLIMDKRKRHVLFLRSLIWPFRQIQFDYTIRSARCQPLFYELSERHSSARTPAIRRRSR
jgi:hypothetical protein